ncbi:GntR family transcriptional regulator [Defluviimonas salinarum]|uniref:GntR family transcriptional regulator n=1 Tax=Defluviimonas salinarum TaxID=2992147 RepID=A0ABT3JAN4_9RHOB|nr:GntR family transcriptional regulator [Defluviimonas salinarum]MCW3784760.1 GntR family transcriptional regulator [Defluviimonas salinarum]
MTQAKDSQLLADKAQKALWTALRSGKLREGQFLSMSQLVDLLDCPIAAIRDAVKHGTSQGLLTTLPKRGVQVMEARPDTIRECLDFRMAFDQEGARRRISEGATTGLTALRERHEDMRNAAMAAAGSHLPPKAIAVDLSLHDFLAEGLGNSLLAAAYAANRMRVAIIQNARPFLQHRIMSAMEEHIAIIDALDRLDAGATTGAIRYHYEQTLRWWGVA